MEMEFLIPSDQLIISIDELKEKKLTYYKIARLVDEGKLAKLNRKYYENKEYKGEFSDLYYAQAYVPHGVICLMSAAVYYELTNVRLSKIDVAISRKSRVSSLPDWPQLQVHHFTDERYGAGVEIIRQEGNFFKIYDIEKTVADVVFYREKIGIEETKEVIVNYLKRSDRNINRLLRYAKNLKCGEILNTYLEVLL